MRSFHQIEDRAVGVNAMAKATSKKSGSPKKATPARKTAARPKLLSGGNPQIAKSGPHNGGAAIRAYIAAMSGGRPGWKRDVGRRLDAMIVRVVPNVRKAVKWNSPFYGVESEPFQGWFLSFHCFMKYVKVAFFRGASLRPPPPGKSKLKDVRYLDIREGDWGVHIDETQLAEWVKQASQLPGERM